MDDNDETPDPPLTSQQEDRVATLSANEVALIDQTLLADAANQWRKIARVVGASMMDLQDRVVGVPDIYYAKRIAKLVNEGVLESQGDLRRMRFCEVRIAG